MAGGGIQQAVGQQLASAQAQGQAQGAAAANQANSTTAQQNNAQAVNNAYSTYLNRAPDQAGYSYWLNALNSGSQTPQSMQQSMLNSPEAASSLSGQANLAAANGPQRTNPALTGQGTLGNQFFYNPSTGSYQTNAGAGIPAPTSAASSSASTPNANLYQGQGSQSATSSFDPTSAASQATFAQMMQQYQAQQNAANAGAGTGASGGIAKLIAQRK
jgi:hypothetical protein